jgi:hypothetical protein
MNFTASLAQNLDAAFVIHQGWGAWLVLLVASLGTYICRAIGVVLSGKVSHDSELFRWLSTVTYAMVAALTIRLIFLPVGLLETIPLYLRFLICLIALSIVFLGTEKKMMCALGVGTILIILTSFFQEYL